MKPEEAYLKSSMEECRSQKQFLYYESSVITSEKQFVDEH